MKFRYKVLVLNVMVLSVSLGIIGYLVIRKNFNMMQESSVSAAVVENNLMRSSVEYDLLQVVNNSTSIKRMKGANVIYRIKDELDTIGGRLKSSLLALDSVSLYIRYDSEYAYSCDGKEEQIEGDLFENLDNGGKQYIICQSEGGYAIYVTSCSSIEEKNLYVVTKMDITENYEMLEEQIRYFEITVFFALLILGVLVYLASCYLTKPLEQVSEASFEIAQGNYLRRIESVSKDEVGQLAGQFNVMADAMEQHIEELEQMIQRREQFVVDFTHEIKTPMTAIIGYADTMRSMELTEKERLTALNYIFSEGKRLENLSRNLFELVYLNKHEIECVYVYAKELAQEVEKITMSILKKKQITLVLEVDEGRLRINRELFVAVFVNLIDNARKATEEGGSIHLYGRNRRENNNYEFMIIDFGIGMSGEERKKMCDEFYMADKSRARKEGGSGLGMSLVKLILERHRAVWNVESEPGKGTKITIQIKEEP